MIYLALIVLFLVIRMLPGQGLSKSQFKKVAIGLFVGLIIPYIGLCAWVSFENSSFSACEVSAKCQANRAAELEKIHNELIAEPVSRPQPIKHKRIEMI